MTSKIIEDNLIFSGAKNLISKKQLYQTLETLKVNQLRQLNREFGLPTTGNQKTLINRLIVGPKQLGGGRPEDIKLRQRLGLESKSDETQWPFDPQAETPASKTRKAKYKVNAPEGFLLNYLDQDGNLPSSVKEEDIKKAAGESGVDLKLDYSPIEWYHLLVESEPPFQALPAYAERFAKEQLSQLSYPQLKELQEIYPGRFTDNSITATATEKMERLRNWYAALPTVQYPKHGPIVHELRRTPTIEQLSNYDSLSLNDLRLRQIPPEIGQLTDLRLLFLDNTELTSLPAEIGQLTNLRSLYLNDNRLTSLPPEIGQLTDLIILSLRDNLLIDFPQNLNLPMLEEIDLQDNKLTSFPTNLKLPRLKTLKLYGNRQLKDVKELNEIYNDKIEYLSDMWLAREDKKRQQKYYSAIRGPRESFRRKADFHPLK